ncbi:c-type cytochrome [Trichlorobacter lovleyi]|uniref:Cytochrome c class I n=1 Tax=Trichlorobacter lovleyi (strain ATCC BAA-1151 / DSM 17278 / SZ) TaxID=398767 RepID=B3EAA5_TRIL1|nr:cytochrome c [Trichlorobacter lovleyi]ACD93933.1 cytochrome c class I [Trichlorobacter lovleyi SZ]
MANRNRFLSCFSTLLVLIASSYPVQADQGKDLFDKQCASCHTIGGGDGGGPDLKGVTEKQTGDWLVRVIVEPDKLTAAKDPHQAELVKKFGFEMPNLGISSEDAKKIIAYLATAGGVAASSSSVPAPEKTELLVTPELIAQGKALFTGSKRFAKGGAPCLSCHPFTYPGISGGNLSIADLNKSYKKMGDAGMQGALKALKFPIMKNMYADRPLTDDEIKALMALFKDSAAQKEGTGGFKTFQLAGGILFFGLLLGLALYKRRIR